tara:strand:- start:6444 stop:8336 length:1893 start_codon:yes stop_codon:yes gene_type:complete
MATNFGYIRRDQDARVNWQEVGKNASDSIQAEIDRRQTIKDDIAADSSALDAQIYENIDSDNADLASEMLSVANLVSEARLRQDQALQNGSLKLKDYTIQRNNLKQGVANISEMNKSKIKIDADFQALVQDGTINPQSVAVKAYNEQFENLNNYGVQLDEFGNPYLAKRIKIKDDVTGVVTETFSTDPNDIYSIKGARANMGQILKQKDFTKAVKDYAGLAGTMWQKSGGGFKSVDDAWQNKNFRKLIEAEIRADLTNPDFASGFAGQYLQGYEYAFLKGDEKAKANQIPLVQINGRWTFDTDSAQGKKIVNESVEKLIEMTRGGMSREEVGYSASEISGFRENKVERQDFDEDVFQVGQLYKATSEQQIRDAMVYFGLKNDKEYKVISSDGNTLTISDGTETVTIDRNVDAESFIEQAGLFLGADNIGRAKKNKRYLEWGFETVNGKQVLRNQPSVISDEINFTITQNPKAEEPGKIITSASVLDGEDLVPATEAFKKSYKDNPFTSIKTEFERFGKGEVIKVQNQFKIKMPGVTTMPLIIPNNLSYEKMLEILTVLESNSSMSQNDVNELLAVPISKDQWLIRNGYATFGQRGEDAWNGGNGGGGSDESSDESSSESNFNWSQASSGN